VLTAQIQPRSVGTQDPRRSSGGWKVSTAASLIKDLYYSPNGDRWALCRDAAGKLVVSHHPNEASGGQASEADVKMFVFVGGHGPEYQALREALADLGLGPQIPIKKAKFL
jgi:hypothetical protein